MQSRIDDEYNMQLIKTKIEQTHKWLEQPTEEKVLDIITTFVVSGAILGLLGLCVWPSVLLPVGIVAVTILFTIVIADEVYVASTMSAIYQSQTKHDNKSNHAEIELLRQIENRL